jgi:cytochrome b subunit of formate dehydrogenase
MPISQPYQPFLLRILHASNALFAIASAITGFLVYDSWDGRWGKLRLTQANRSLIDIHGTVAFFLFFIFIGFTFYSLRYGRQHLIPPDAASKLTQIGKPIWWHTLHRITNTAILASLSLSVLSGKFQDENWLPAGDLNRIWYFVHLIAWVIFAIAIALHLLMSAKVGGIPLFLSMFDRSYSPEESPALWKDKIMSWLRSLKR